MSQGHLVETDRAGLVAGYVGQTELKTDSVIKSAIGGVLFIDEAYSLFKGDSSQGDFGQEAISVLLKRMEDYRNDLVIIVAGYQKPMTEFLESNEGLKSRFSTHICFDDYSPDELLSILKHFCDKSNYELSSDALPKASEIISEAFNKREEHFGNARYVRNLFESAMKAQAVRITMTEGLPTPLELKQLLAEDFKPLKTT